MAPKAISVVMAVALTGALSPIYAFAGDDVAELKRSLDGDHTLTQLNLPYEDDYYDDGYYGDDYYGDDYGDDYYDDGSDSSGGGSTGGDYGDTDDPLGTVEGILKDLQYNLQYGSVYVSSRLTYDGDPLYPKLSVQFATERISATKYKLKTLKYGRDYTVTYTYKGRTVSQPVNAGRYTVTFKGIGKYYGSNSGTLEVTGMPVRITKPTPKKTISSKALQRGDQTYKLDSICLRDISGDRADKIKMKISACKVKYSVSSYQRSKTISSALAKKYIKISKSGKVTVKKGAPKGQYNLKVKTNAGGEGTNYLKASDTWNLSITVK